MLEFAKKLSKTKSFYCKINYFTVAEASAEAFWPKLRFLPKLRLRPKQEKCSFGRTLSTRNTYRKKIVENRDLYF